MPPDRNFAWVVVQAEGNDGSTSRPMRVKRADFDLPFDIDALMDAVKAKFAPLLDHASVMELKVYADDQELTTVDALVADQSAGWTADNPLVITYPPRAGLMRPLPGDTTTSGKPADRLEYAAFFDRLFEEADVHPMYTSPQITRQGYIDALAQSHMAIIDMPAERLALPLLSFKTENEVAKVMDMTALAADPRNKSLVAVVRGTGGGKTRALEELRFALLQQKGLLALAYTYNAGMGMSAADSAWAEDSSLSRAKQARVCYPFTVVARLACSLYGQELSSIEVPLRRAVRLFDFEEWDLSRDFDVEMIRGFIIHAVRKLRSAGTTVQEVVVLADEVLKVQEDFERNFGIPPNKDITSVLRKAMLDQEIMGDLRSGLVISSLAPSPLGKTLSERGVVPVELAPLIPEAIVRDWWGIADAKHQDKLIATAAALCDLPRAVQFAHDYIKTRSTTDAPSMNEIVSLMDSVMCRINQRYQPQMISRKHLRAVVFQEEIALDEDAIDSVMNSRFTNTINDFGGKPQIIPTASLVMLSAGAQRRKPGYDKCLVILREFVDNLVVKEKGDVLEWALEWWLRLRLALVEGEEATLQKLFQIDAVPQSQPYLNKAMSVTFVGPDVKVIQHGRWPSSHDGAASFMQNLDTITLGPGEAAIVHLHPKEVFDLLLAVRAKTGRIFLVCIEAKSSAGGGGPKNGLPDQGKQAKRLRQVVEQSGVTDGTSLSGAFARGDYIFLYLSSHKGPREDQELAAVLRRDDTERFLGPLWNIYRSVRTGADAS